MKTKGLWVELVTYFTPLCVLRVFRVLRGFIPTLLYNLPVAVDDLDHDECFFFGQAVVVLG